MPYNNIITNRENNMYTENLLRQPPRPNNFGRPGRPGGFGNSSNFLLPFALGFATSPLLFGPRPRYYYPPYPYYPYYPYY